MRLVDRAVLHTVKSFKYPVSYKEIEKHEFLKDVKTTFSTVRNSLIHLVNDGYLKVDNNRCYCSKDKKEDVV